MHQLLLSMMDDLLSGDINELNNKSILYNEYVDAMMLNGFHLLKEIKPVVKAHVDNIPGLFYIRNFLDMTEMKFINKKIESIHFEPITTSPNSRRVAHFGYFYSYDRSGLEVAPPIPEYMKILVTKDKINSILGYSFLTEEFDQLIINEYKSGQRIADHIDHVRQFGPIIACISLGSPVDVRFTLGSVKKDVRIRPGSLYIMTGDSRYKWTHSLVCKSEVRYSLTFRAVRFI